MSFYSDDYVARLVRDRDLLRTAANDSLNALLNRSIPGTDPRYMDSMADVCDYIGRHLRSTLIVVDTDSQPKG